jgi:dihydropteroate synthase
MLWQIVGRSIEIGVRPLVMGIVNVTPDSFSDGGQFATTDLAIEHGLRLAAEGADFLDIGGESSRPGATPVTLDEELARVIPVIQKLASKVSVPISVDTTKAEVARQAVAAGAAVINDITAGRGDADMAESVRQSGAGVVLMHMQGTPATMHLNPTYEDVVRDVHDFLRDRMKAFQTAGVDPKHIALDPGIGFGKSHEHNLLLLRHLDQISSLERPVLLGLSRKGFLGTITGRARNDRLVSSVAAVCFCAARGTAHILRVHDVAATVDAAKVVAAIAGA